VEIDGYVYRAAAMRQIKQFAAATGVEMMMGPRRVTSNAGWPVGGGRGANHAPHIDQTSNSH